MSLEILIVVNMRLKECNGPPRQLQQAELDSYFAIADQLLRGIAECPEGDGVVWPCCHNCGCRELVVCYRDGGNVCSNCGMVQLEQVYQDAVQFVRKLSNYKRIHHFHERISQLMLNESTIPSEHLARITQSFKESSAILIDKCTVRKILRSLNLQVYIEKWLSIIWHIAGVRPPPLSQKIMIKLDLMFIALQGPFARCKPDHRKNFLNYNYVFNRLFDLLGLPEYNMFFPLIKSKSKIKALDETWERMCLELGWENRPLVQPKTFIVKV